MDHYRIVIADDHVLIRRGLAGIMKGVADLEVIGEAVRAIKTKYPDVKILILTMHREYVHQSLSAGADGYLLKEDADRDLFHAIENIRQGRVYLSTRLTGELSGVQGPSCELLSIRGKEVLKLIAGGKSDKEIAEFLFISVRTVESHRAEILAKLGLNSAADLVTYAIQEGYD